MVVAVCFLKYDVDVSATIGHFTKFFMYCYTKVSNSLCLSWHCLLVLQGLVTLQLTRETGYSRGYLSARSVTGFLSDVYSAAADEIGKIHLIADQNVSI